MYAILIVPYGAAPSIHHYTARGFDGINKIISNLCQEHVKRERGECKTVHCWDTAVADVICDNGNCTRYEAFLLEDYNESHQH